MPDSSKKILYILNIKIDERTFKNLKINFCVKKGTKINETEQIFPRYDE